MADIFGRQPTDYAHIRALMKVGKWEEQQRACEAAGRPHNFDALGVNGKVSRSMERVLPGDIARAEPNAQAAGYLTNNLQAVANVIDEVLYLGGRRVSRFIPIRTDIAQGAKSYIRRVVDRVGRGQFITSEGTDAPSAKASLRAQPIPLGYGGIDGEWTAEDLRAAMFGGFPLDMEVVRAATEGALSHIARVAFNGDAHFTSSSMQQGLVGFSTGTDADDVRLTTLTSQTWATRTGEQIITHMRNAVSHIINDTKETLSENVMADMVIALPTTQFDLVSSLRYGEASDRSVAAVVLHEQPVDGPDRASCPVPVASRAGERRRVERGPDGGLRQGRGGDGAGARDFAADASSPGHGARDLRADGVQGRPAVPGAAGRHQLHGRDLTGGGGDTGGVP